MPLYDFQCTGCGEVTEVLIRNLRELDKEITCRACLHPMRRLITSSYLINMPTGNSVGKTNYS